MRKGIEALAAVHFFLVSTLLFIGLFFLILPKAPHFRFLLSELIATRSEVFAPIGGVISSLAIMLAASFYALYRHRTLYVTMLHNPIEVDPVVIEKYVNEYFLEYFPDLLSKTQVSVSKKQRLEVTVYTTKIATSEKQQFLLQCEQELGDLFKRVLDYDRDFLFKWVSE